MNQVKILGMMHWFGKSPSVRRMIQEKPVPGWREYVDGNRTKKFKAEC